MSLEPVIVRDEITPWLFRVSKQLSDSKRWMSRLMPAVRGLQRFLRGISPVITGSYRASHQITIGKNVIRLGVNPAARNTATNILVSKYAPRVEEKWHVYAHGADQAERVFTRVLGELAEELGFGD